jgi:lysophospholipase L1-like esterase
MTTKLKFLRNFFTAVLKRTVVEYFHKPIATNNSTKSDYYSITTNNGKFNNSETISHKNVRVVNNVIQNVDTLTTNSFASLNPIPFNLPTQMDILVQEDFNPSAKSYTNLGTATRNITGGTMLIGGGTGFFTNVIQCNDVVWVGNDWFIEYIFSLSNVNTNEIGICMGLNSINVSQNQSLNFGVYAAVTPGNFNVDIFNATNSTQLISSGSSGNRLNAAIGNKIKVTAFFKESVLTVIATNLDNPNTVVVSYTFSYALAAPNIKPNSGKLNILASSSTATMYSWKFGTAYYKNVDVLFLGDSITSGYYVGNESSRFQNVYSSLTGKTVATFAGAADRTIEIVNSTSLSMYTSLLPKKVHILIGSNDVANGILNTTIQNNLTTIINAFLAIGTKVYIGTLLPRNGVNLTTINTFIRNLSNVTVIEYYNVMESSPGSGNINPVFSDDNIHPNVTGAAFIAQKAVLIGM